MKLYMPMVPVKVLYPSDEELKNLEYRSKKELTGQVRIVEIPGADVWRLLRNPCRTYGRSGYNQNKDDDPL